jgi:hypothetical protein
MAKKKEDEMYIAELNPIKTDKPKRPIPLVDQLCVCGHSRICHRDGKVCMDNDKCQDFKAKE